MIDDMYNQILNIFQDIIDDYRLTPLKKGDYTVELFNNVCSLIINFERFYEGVAFFFLDHESKKKYPFWKLYEIKGKPTIMVDYSLNKNVRNIKWHSIFIKDYLVAEMQSGILPDSIPDWPPFPS